MWNNVPVSICSRQYTRSMHKYAAKLLLFVSDIAGSEIKNVSTKCVDTFCSADEVIGTECRVSWSWTVYKNVFVRIHPSNLPSTVQQNDATCCAAWAFQPSAVPPCATEDAFPRPSLCCGCNPIRDCTSCWPVLDSAAAGDEPFAAGRACCCCCCCCNKWWEDDADARGSFFFGFGFTRSDAVKPVAFR